MANDELDLRQLVARLRTSQFRSYLVARGWEEQPSRYVDHVYFKVGTVDGGDLYELYLPASTDVPNYQTRVMRAIYKLCGIEDCEPLEIAQAVFASAEANEVFTALASTNCLRVRNTGSQALQLRIDKPAREHVLLPGEAVELICELPESGALQIERGDSSLTIFTSIGS